MLPRYKRKRRGHHVLPVKPNEAGSEKEKEVRDCRQVALDVSRMSLSKAACSKLERRIVTILGANPPLHYYQGFHDIAMHTHSSAQLENLALQQLRDFMASDLEPTTQILKLVPELLARADPNGIGAYFVNAEGRRAAGYFALAPVVTLFSHECNDTKVIAPIIRCVLREGLSYVLYLYAALLITNGPGLISEKKKGGALEAGVSEDDVLEMAMQGVAATLAIDNYADLDRLARRLRSKHSLKWLTAYQKVSRYSVLKVGKVTKRNTALYYLNQLENESKTVVNSRTALLLAIGALAVGMLWRFRR